MMKTSVPVILALAIAALPGTESGAVSCEQAIVQKLQQRYQLDADRYSLEVVSCRLEVSDVTPEQVVIQPLVDNQPRGLFLADVTVTDQGRELQRDRVKLRLREFANVLVTTDKIRRHDSFSDGNLSVRRMDITDLYEKPVSSLADLEASRAKRHLRKGIILTRGAVELVPDLEAGQEVNIVYSDVLCRISTPGTVLQSGMAGDYVKVKNKSSGKIVIARVVDSRAVAVDP